MYINNNNENNNNNNKTKLKQKNSNQEIVHISLKQQASETYLTYLHDDIT